MSKVVQCELRAVTGDNLEPLNVRHMVTWLEAGKAKPGNLITLKDMEPVKWEVVTVGQAHERSDIKRGWGMTDYFGKETDRKKEGK